MRLKARCGHLTSRSYAKAHHGLCRRCHSSFAFLVELEEKSGEDALVRYWYQMIVENLPEEATNHEKECLLNHLIDFYQRKLDEVPSKHRYIQKMLYMLNSIKEPFDAAKFA
jgi:hypothetical protein